MLKQKNVRSLVLSLAVAGLVSTSMVGCGSDDNNENQVLPTTNYQSTNPNPYYNQNYPGQTPGVFPNGQVPQNYGAQFPYQYNSAWSLPASPCNVNIGVMYQGARYSLPYYYNGSSFAYQGSFGWAPTLWSSGAYIYGGFRAGVGVSVGGFWVY